MTKSLHLSNHIKATLSLAGSENIMTIIAPEIQRRFSGKKAFTSPWTETSIEPIHGTLSYLHAAQLIGECDATVEVIGDTVNAEFKLVFGGPGLEDTIVATFKGEFISSYQTDHIRAYGFMALGGNATHGLSTTVLQGSWGPF